MNLTRVKPWLIAAVVAAVYNFVVAVIWAFLPRLNPITDWLLDTYARSAPNIYFALVWVHDIIVNILVALPFAAVIGRIRPDRRWSYVALSVLIVFVWQYRVVLFDIGLLDFVKVSPSAWLGIVFTFVYLPVALLIASLLERRTRTLV